MSKNFEVDTAQILSQFEHIDKNKFYESFYTKQIRELINPPDEVTAFLGQVRAEVQRVCNHADYVIIVGRSRGISRAVLRGCGIPIEKIIDFDDKVNSAVYKLDTQEVEHLTDDERREVLESSLRALLPPQQEQLSIVIFDDISDSGLKAWHYLSFLSQFSFLRDYTFVCLTGNTKRVDENEEDYFSLIREKFGNSPDGHYQNLHAKLPYFAQEHPQVFAYFKKLAAFVSNMYPTHMMFGWVPPHLYEALLKGTDLIFQQLKQAAQGEELH